ncbi:MAG: T9SS type A sorting domain-containing protein [Bacteroidetes bacterium]|nr:T9SS type A sorting domain-containing protein [Bacteroidota bacterium]
MTKFLPRLFFFLCFLSLGRSGFSQQAFQHFYGGINQEISLVAFPCPGGGIYYLGATTSTGSGSADPVIMKLDDDGEVIWAHAIGGVNYDVAGAMTLSSDSGLVYAGSTKSYNGNTLDDLYFFKTDSMGSMQWSKTFSTADLDVASAIIRTSDNGYAITGYTRETGLKRVLLIRTDSNGDTLFTRTYGGNGDDQGVEMLQTSDGGFVIIGKTFTQTLGESDILMMRTDSQGNLLWTKSYGESLWDEGAGIIKLQDGNYLISGSTISFGQGDFDILLMKTDTSGSIIWGKTYGGAKTDAGYTARENNDGSIVVSGYSNSLGYGHNMRLARQESATKKIHANDFSLRKSISDIQSNDRGDDSTNIFLMKVDAAGDTLWTRTYGDGAQDEAFHFSKMDDGGYLMPGFTTSYTNTTDSTQMMLIRTDSSGYSGCHEQNAHPLIDTTNFITQTLAFTQTQGISENIVVSNSLVWNLNAEDACLYIQVSDNNEEEIEVYPIPASSKLVVDSRQYTISAISINNLLGEMVLAVSLPNDSYREPIDLDVSQLPSGIYFLKLTTSTSEIIKKIIIQKN